MAEEPEPSTFHIGIAVLNWQNAPDTIRCLESLRAAGALGDADVIVVDNGSTDGSADQIAGWISAQDEKRLSYVRRPTNDGYGVGNNAAIERLLRSGVDWVWILNNDCQVTPAAYKHLRVALSRASGTGAVGVRIHAPGTPVEEDVIGGGRIRHAAMTRPLRAADFTSTQLESGYLLDPRLDFIHGASIVLRSDTLRECGLLPVDHFLFWEEAELCARIRRTGATLAVATHAVVEHAEGTTSGVSKGTRKTEAAHFYAARGLVLYLRKQRPRVVAIGVLIRLLYAARMTLRDRDLTAGRAIVCGLWRGLRQTPAAPPPAG